MIKSFSLFLPIPYSRFSGGFPPIYLGCPHSLCQLVFHVQTNYNFWNTSIMRWRDLDLLVLVWACWNFKREKEEEKIQNSNLTKTSVFSFVKDLLNILLLTFFGKLPYSFQAKCQKKVWYLNLIIHKTL